MISGSKILIIVLVFSTLSGWGRQPIVPPYIKESKDFLLASEFLEHYYDLLRSPKTQSSADTLRMAKEQGFKYLVGNDKRFLSLKGDEEFDISFSGDIYSAQWSKNGNPIISCTFPPRIDLLTFSNKIDLENRMLHILKDLPLEVSSQSRPTADRSKLKKIDYSPFYVRDLGYYITPRLAHQVLFQPIDSVSKLCELLVDSPKYSLECLANTMLTGYSGNLIIFQLSLDRYGYESVETTISLPHLFSKLSEEGSMPYWGVEEYDGDIVKGLYVWLNKPGGFAHILSVDIPISAQASPAEVRAKMHSYVRLDNLKSLFEEFQ